MDEVKPGEGAPSMKEAMHQIAASNVALADMAYVLDAMRKTLLKAKVRPSAAVAQKMADALSGVSMVALSNARLIKRAGAHDEKVGNDGNAPSG